ncbi:glycosyltransferase family protein [Saccharococcus caldoxylosilyticus]|uniref:hypothetical protein n=1 Tax=Saccharococcus caldoxylosilyticus TaxID=81408 RepID=UPI001C4E11AA|nr:hypothetical protein [Parageobacillus caldoxylosilyticus]
MTGIIVLINITYCPYVHKYIDVLSEIGEDFEVIYWNRLNKSDANPEWKTHEFNLHSQLNKNKLLKIKDFYEYRKFIKRIIRERKYDKLIVLTTLTGIMLADILLSEFRGRYILDIRDYTFDRLPGFRHIEEKLISHSDFTAISSEGFKTFLPKGYEYVIAHNFLYSDIEAMKSFKKRKWEINQPINLDFLGSIRHFELDSKLVETFAKDSRFSISYHGDGPSYEKLKSFCEENQFNVQFTGPFNKNDKPKLLSNVDIINAYYGEDSFINQYALSNKFYDSIIYKIPLLANSKLYSGKLVEKYKTGISVNLNEEGICDRVYEEFIRFDFDQFYERCSEILESILDEDRYYCDRIAKFAKK